MSPWDRCITRSPTLMLPAGYNNGIRIVQTSGFVIIEVEKIHEARIVPTDGGRMSIRDHDLDRRSARTLGRRYAGRRQHELPRPRLDLDARRFRTAARHAQQHGAAYRRAVHDDRSQHDPMNDDGRRSGASSPRLESVAAAQSMRRLPDLRSTPATKATKQSNSFSRGARAEEASGQPVKSYRIVQRESLVRSAAGD